MIIKNQFQNSRYLVEYRRNAKVSCQPNRYWKIQIRIHIGE